jgi:predicted metal-dependent hydrolase
MPSISSFTIDDIPVNIVTKNIWNLNLRITPPLGNVIVSAPHGYPEVKIHDFVRSKLQWIRKHQERIRKTKYSAPLKYETGEEHYFLGKGYRLEVVERKQKPSVSIQGMLDSGYSMSMSVEDKEIIKLSNSKSSNSITVQQDPILIMTVRPGTRKKKRQAVLDAWYRERLKEIVPIYIALYEPKMNVAVSAWGIKKMKTKWGTCNITKKRIWLNLELAKKPVEAIEQVVVHELVHLLERKHTKRFYALVKEYLGRDEEKL